MGTATNTYSSLVQYVRDTAGSDRTDTFTDRLIARAVQNGLQRCSLARNWEHLKDRIVLATTVPDGTSVTTNQATATHGSKLVTCTDAEAAWAGAWLRFNGEPLMYEIASASAGASFTLRDAFQGTSATADYEILFPFLALPDNLNVIYAVVDASRRVQMVEAKGQRMYWLNVQTPSQGQPYQYDVETKRGGANKQLWLWPIPGTTVYRYEIIYYRHAGWWDSGTNVYKNNNDPDVTIADADYVDWPNHYMDLLRHACLMAAYDEAGDPRSQHASARFHQELARCSSNDDPTSPVEVLGDTPSYYPSDRGRIIYP